MNADLLLKAKKETNDLHFTFGFEVVAIFEIAAYTLHHRGLLWSIGLHSLEFQIVMLECYAVDSYVVQELRNSAPQLS